MAFPWKTIGRFALQFAEYATAQKYAPQASAPAVAPVQPAPLPPVAVAPPVAAPDPPPAPVLTLEQRFSDRLDTVYMEEWGRVIGKETTGDATERYQGYKLLEAGREDELRHNLRGRK